jgi:predicted nucleotidyltransferase
MFKELNDLRFFFEEPNRVFHLRELGRLQGKNPVTIKKHLQAFVKEGILSCRKERGLEIYSSNSENFLYKEHKRVYNRFKLIESGFLEHLNKELNLPLIIVFGSYEKGEDNKNSDADIFVLSESRKKIALESYEKKINRTIQLHIMSRKEFEKAKKENGDLINSIINGSVMSGFIEVI